MEIKDALDIMNSDFKLWEAATEKPLGAGVVEKTINLPWGIGETTVTLEGMNDSNKRRAAVGAYGEYIRGLINERTNDEAIESRARQAAAKAEQDDSGDSVGVDKGQPVRGGSDGASLPPKTDARPSDTYEEDVADDADLRETLLARRAKVDERIGRLTEQLDTACRDLRGLDAALSAMEEDLT